MVKKVLIVGSGVMGVGIANLCAMSNYEVSILTRSATDKEEVRKNIKRDSAYYKKGKSVSSNKDIDTFPEIEIITEYTAISNADLIIECVLEDLDIKKDVISRLSKYKKNSAIIATNTSSLSITELSLTTSDPDNFIGLHFFNPAKIMKLNEIILGLLTSDHCAVVVKDFSKSISKTPVVVNEAPGFIVNRLLIPMINEAIAILVEGVADKEDIDSAMKLGANHPIGPLSLADLIGNDVCLSILDILHKETGDQKYRAHPYLKKMVRGGKLGRKTGVGFYSYRGK